MFDLGAIIAADYPGMQDRSVPIYERCGVHLPRIAEVVLSVLLSVGLARETKNPVAPWKGYRTFYHATIR